MDLIDKNREYLRTKVSKYVLVKNGKNNPLEKKDENGLFTWNSNEKLRDSDNKMLTVAIAGVPAVITAAGVLTGIAGLVFVGGATFSGNQQHAEMGAQALQTAGDILKVGLESAVVPVSIFGLSVCNSWYKKIYNSRVEKRENAIRIRNLINMMTGTRSRKQANKDTESYKIAISLYQEVDLSKMRKNMILELLSSLAAFKEKEDLLSEGQAKEEEVTVARNNFFQTYCRLLETKDCPRDLATNATIYTMMKNYGEKEQQEIDRQRREMEREQEQKIINIAKARRLLELKKNGGMTPSMINQMASDINNTCEEQAVVGMVPKK